MTSKIGRGGRRYLPLAFTEHGAIMAATVLNSRRAIQMSIFVVRAFVPCGKRCRLISKLLQNLLNWNIDSKAMMENSGSGSRNSRVDGPTNADSPQDRLRDTDRADKDKRENATAGAECVNLRLRTTTPTSERLQSTAPPPSRPHCLRPGIAQQFRGVHRGGSSRKSVSPERVRRSRQ